MPSSSSLPGCQALLPGGSPVPGSCLALRRQVGSVHVPLLLSPREETGESGCQLWLVKPLNMGALCGGVWRGAETEKLLLPLGEQRHWPWRLDDWPIFPTFPPFLIACSFHHRLPGLKALFLFCCQAQWLWLHSKAGHSDLIQKLCMGHISTICPPPHTLPHTPWWLETSSGLETGDSCDQDSNSSSCSS